MTQRAVALPGPTPPIRFQRIAAGVEWVFIALKRTTLRPKHRIRLRIVPIGATRLLFSSDDVTDDELSAFFAMLAIALCMADEWMMLPVPDLLAHLGWVNTPAERARLQTALSRLCRVEFAYGVPALDVPKPTSSMKQSYAWAVMGLSKRGVNQPDTRYLIFLSRESAKQLRDGVHG